MLQVLDMVIHGLNTSVEWTLLMKSLIAFAVGALIGLEREKAKQEAAESGNTEDVKEFPGVRSFGFVSLLGALTIIAPYYMPSDIAQYVLIPLILPPIFTILFFIIHRMLILKESGITTPLALGLAYVLGVLVGLGYVLEAVALSVLITFMLAVKLHIVKAIRGVTYRELLSALEIGIIVFLLGPFLARDIYDPLLHVVNFKTLYIFFVIILIISYIGYMVVKMCGMRALTYFAFFGGLVHSEATTINLIVLGQKLGFRNAVSNLVLGGILSANLAMVIRNLLIFTFLRYTMAITAEISRYTVLTMLALLATALALYIPIKLKLIQSKPQVSTNMNIRGEEVPSLTSPINYRAAIKYCLLFAAILVMTTLATMYFSDKGLLTLSILGGLVSSEAMIFSALSLLQVGLASEKVVSISVMLTTLAAILNKLLYAVASKVPRALVVRLLMYLLIATSPLLIAALILIFGAL